MDTKVVLNASSHTSGLHKLRKFGMIFHLLLVLCLVLFRIFNKELVRSINDIGTLLTDKKRFKDHTVRRYARPEIAWTNEGRLASVRDSLFALLEASHRLNFTLFLDGGSLLGYYRHGDLIPWDDDGDAGFFVNDCERRFPNEGDFGKAFESVIDIQRFEAMRFSCRGGNTFEGEYFHAGKFVDKKTGFFVDLFPFEIKENSVIATQFKEFNVPLNDFLPLKQVSFIGTEYAFVPNNVFKHLRCWYGADLNISFHPYGFFFIHMSVISFIMAFFFLIATFDYLFAVSIIAAFFLLSGFYVILSAIIASIITFVFYWSSEQNSTSKTLIFIAFALFLASLLRDVLTSNVKVI